MYTHATKKEQTKDRISSTNNEAQHSNVQEWNPSQILKHRGEKIPLPQPILQKRITQIPNTRKNNGTGEENLETM